MRTARLLSRILAIVAAATLVSIVAGSSRPENSPYLSALSSLTAGSVMAGSTCANKACSTDPNTGKFICVKSAGTTCSAFNSKGPIASKCIENAC